MVRADLQNDYTRGISGYPGTLTEAYDILVAKLQTSTTMRTRLRHRHSVRHNRRTRATTTETWARGTRARGRGGGGCGRRRRPGTRNKGRKTEDGDAGTTEAEDKTTKDENAQYSSAVFTAKTDKCLLSGERHTLPTAWLLLDSCSTVNSHDI